MEGIDNSTIIVAFLNCRLQLEYYMYGACLLFVDPALMEEISAV
jgi:hypothetical protein